LTAAYASAKPQPKWLFGTWSMPPQSAPVVAVTFGLAVLVRICLVSAIFRTSSECADHSRATTPTTCGPAIEVPLKNP
jgi:hypothetical protein